MSLMFRLNPVTQLKKHLSKPKPKKMYSDADVSQVMQIGYTKDTAVCALESCRGDINRACNMLLEYWLDDFSLHDTLQCCGIIVSLSVCLLLRLLYSF